MTFKCIDCKSIRIKTRTNYPFGKNKKVSKNTKKRTSRTIGVRCNNCGSINVV